MNPVLLQIAMAASGQMVGGSGFPGGGGMPQASTLFQSTGKAWG
jgi:hypothetical protein